MSMSRVFVSYTHRDGFISDSFLECVESWLSDVCQPYIHRVKDATDRLEQFRVVRALLRSHVVLILDSPSIDKSPWVRLELALAKLKMMPIIKLPAEEFLELYSKSDDPSQADSQLGSSRTARSLYAAQHL